jgi:hypothetical protein
MRSARTFGTGAATAGVKLTSDSATINTVRLILLLVVTPQKREFGYRETPFIRLGFAAWWTLITGFGRTIIYIRALR